MQEHDAPHALRMLRKGRDVADIEKAMAFDSDSCVWTITGEAREVRTSEARQRIIAAMTEIGAPATPTEIAAVARMTATNVRQTLLRMGKHGSVRKEAYGKYSVTGAV
jgi:hypothetical protein